MALTAGANAGDVSGAIEMTIGFFGFNKFNSGKYGLYFDFTGNSAEKLWGKDITMNAGDSTALPQAFFLEYLQMNCGTGTGMAMLDGSAGTEIARLNQVDASNAGGGLHGVWDWRDDPLICLTADNTTTTLCVSAGNGFVSGYVKGYWGSVSL